MNFSKYKNIFCDSKEALEWAYNNNLPKDAIVKSGSPAMLWDANPNIVNIESRWTVDESNRFKDSILEMSEDVFNEVLNVDGVERGLALTISKSVLHFHRMFLYKAACLTEDDFISPRLFIYVNGESGPIGNIMNSPWVQILSSNPLFSIEEYTLKNDKWEVLSTNGVTYWKRFKVAGYKTAIYRLLTQLIKYIPHWLFTKEVFMPNENELNIEIAYSLLMNRVRVTKVDLNPATCISSESSERLNEEIYNVISPIMNKKVRQWVTPSGVEACMSLFKSHVYEQTDKFNKMVEFHTTNIKTRKNIKQAVLMNAPGNVKGYALSHVCRKKGIMLMSSQHGITVEISKAHDMYSVMFDSAVSNVLFSYNSKIVDIESNTKFDFAKHYVIGMPERLIGMRSMESKSKLTNSIVYISTNLYQMGFSISSKTDYMNAKDEKAIIDNVLSKLPHKVCYKTYPSDNRRYADNDPVLNSVIEASNMKIFSKKIDMRYLISEHDIFVTTGATSTLGWPIMSGKPVVFIDNKNKSPLTEDAHASLSKGIFVFNSEDEDFHEKLRDFLSKPVSEIQSLWNEKESMRKKMLTKYFSKFDVGAGKRAAKIILDEYLS